MYIKILLKNQYYRFFGWYRYTMTFGILIPIPYHIFVFGTVYHTTTSVTINLGFFWDFSVDFRLVSVNSVEMVTPTYFKRLCTLSSLNSPRLSMTDLIISPHLRIQDRRLKVANENRLKKKQKKKIKMKIMIGTLCPTNTKFVATIHS